MNSNDCHKNRWAAWWARSGASMDAVLFLVVVSAMLALILMLLFIPITARAGGCLSIEVPPQAVLGNYDGDTFTVFSFQPGGVVKIRVQGVNTPERNQPGWAEAKAFTREWLAKGPFKISTCGKPTLDRIVGSVERNGRTLAQDLIDLGYGRE